MPNATRPQESVWDYPRPPRLDPDDRRVLVRAGDLTLADTTSAVRVLETSHPPVFYVPPTAVTTGLLTPSSHITFCEFKGKAAYWDLRSDNVVPQVAWSYPNPTSDFAIIANWIAFYPSKVECFVAGERVDPQVGDFYGGWITTEIMGPFKGGPGTRGW